MEDSEKKEFAQRFEDAFAKRKEALGLEARLMAGEILSEYPEGLRDIALEWLESGEDPDTEIDGLSLKIIRERSKASFIQAMRIFRLYLDNPKEAVSLIKAYERRTDKE